MSVIETLTFRLAAGADEAVFLDADTRVQTEFIPNHPGFLRRTTARAADGEWIVVTLWASESDADVSRARWETHDATRDFESMLDASTLRRAVYTTLD